MAGYVARLPGIQVFNLDIGMPVMDGYDLARRLRANPATQHAMLVALTGYKAGARLGAVHGSQV